jgi:hypothetical protein
MGGFLFMEKRDDPDNLGAIASPYAEPLKTLISHGETRVTKDHIKDKSKGDIISKGIVIFQILWFIFQFVARIHQKLPISELELVTIGYTVLNLVTYFFWWHKPQNLSCPLRVYAKDLPSEKDLQEQSSGSEESERLLLVPQSSVCNIPKTQTITHFKGRWAVWQRMAGLLFNVMIGAGNKDDDSGFFTEEVLWYTGESTRGKSFIIFTASATLACIFGGIHLVAWNFGFPTSTERLIWRTMAVIIMAVPVCGLAESLLLQVTDKTLEKATDDTIWDFFALVPAILLIFAYAIARIILLVQVFVLLRSVSPEIYQTVAWTNYIPHV